MLDLAVGFGAGFELEGCGSLALKERELDVVSEEFETIN